MTLVQMYVSMHLEAPVAAGTKHSSALIALCTEHVVNGLKSSSCKCTTAVVTVYKVKANILQSSILKMVCMCRTTLI